MFPVIRRHLSYSNVAATLALVFAVTGGAFAATGHIGAAGSGATASGSRASASSSGATASAAYASAAKSKAKSKGGARGPAGPKGATGATGATGSAGATGPGGAQGSAGTNGTNGTSGEPGKEGTPGAAGESVKSHEFTGEKEGKCPEGGSEFKVGTKTATYACNGEKGVIHPGETLAPEASETGAWSFGPITAASVPNVGGFGVILDVPVASFAIPLAAILPEADVHYINPAGEEVTNSGPVSGTPADCKGDKNQPTAEPGNFCVYAGEEEGVETRQERILQSGNNQEGAGTTGAIERFEVTGSFGAAHGTWAVTAPAAGS